MFDKRRTLTSPVNASGLCQCGCGEPAPIATTNRPERGYQAGHPTRFIPGHQVERGPKASKWKGGTYLHRSGYVYELAPGHPFKNADGYVFQHRLVMERHLGRYLTPAERVHHKNHTRADNRIENLELIGSHSDHMSQHHARSLAHWRETNPEAAQELAKTAGKRGADVRWGKRHADTRED